MDIAEWKKRNVGLPTDPAKQEGPSREAQPGEGGAGLTDLSGDNGGQRTEVGAPYDGRGDVQRGVEKEQHED